MTTACCEYAPAGAAPGPMGGAHQRPPPRVHRLGHLPGQPARIAAEHPPDGAPARHRRGPRRLRPAAGPGHLRDLRPQTRRLLRRQAQGHPRLLLHRHRPAGRRPRHPAPARRRRRDRRRGHRARSWPRSQPAALQACLAAAEQLEHGHDAALEQWRRQAERGPLRTRPAPSAATRPSTPTTGWSPAAWKPPGKTRSPNSPPPKPNSPAARPPGPQTLTAAERAAILALGDDLGAVWDAATTTDKDRKQLLRTLLDEVNITVRRDTRRRPRRTGAALERRRDHRAGRPAQAHAPMAAPHRRGHHRPGPPARGPLPRREDRRDPQPAAPHHRPGIVVHRQ